MRPLLFLAASLVAASSARAAVPAGRSVEAAAAVASARGAVHGIIDASAARHAPAKARVVEVIDGVPRLKLDGEVAVHGKLVPNGSRDVWRAPINGRAFDDVREGERIAVTDLGGRVVGCTVSRIEVLDRGASMDGFDGGGDAPTCGAEEVWAALTCDDDTTGGIAVAADDETPTVWHLDGPAPGSSADTATDRLWESGPWQAAVASARERDGAEMRENIAVTQWSGGDGAMFAVEAAVWTGTGDVSCGGDDINTHVVGIVNAEGEVVVPFIEIPYAYETDLTSIVGMVDVDRDGSPELWTGPLGFDGSVFAIGRTGVALQVDHPWCGCPC